MQTGRDRHGAAGARAGAPGLPAGSATPLYLRVQERIRESILAGRWRPQEALPGERDLADTFDVSRVTIRKAIGGLVEDGLLQQRQGSGTYVAGRPARVEQALSRLTSFTEDMRVRGLKPSVTVLGREVSPPTPQEAMRLNLSPRERVSRLRRLRLAGGVPMAIELASLPQDVLPNPGAVGSSLYAVLEARGARPVRALQRLTAANLEPEEAGLLGVPAGAAALAIERVSFLPDGRPVEFTRSWYRGDTYDFVAELSLREDP